MNEIDRIKGKRQMLWHIQRQAIANGGYVDMGTLSALSKVIQVEEMINEVDYSDSELDTDMHKQSLELSKDTTKINVEGV